MLEELRDCVGCLFVFWLVFGYHCFQKVRRFCFPRPLETIASEKKLIVVTGCDSGFGRLLVEHLYANGDYNGGTIVALTLTEAAAKELSGSGKTPQNQNQNRRLVGMKCDVTSEGDVRNMKKQVLDLCHERDLKLYAIINNAGITTGSGASLFFTSPEPFIANMQVNYFGMLRVTFALQELLVTSNCNGRIVNVSSTAGTFPIALNAAYNASKHAVETWSDTIRTELEPFGVHVIKIRPGNFGTGIFQKCIAEIKKNFDAAPSKIRDLYGGEQWIQTYMKQFAKPAIEGVRDPMEVVKMIEKALLLARPHPYYWVGPDAKILFRALYSLPEEARANFGPALFVPPVKND